MAYLGLLAYFVLLLMQCNVWIPSLQGIPVLEVSILVISLLCFPTLLDGGLGRIIFRCPQTKLLAAFFLWSVLSLHYAGFAVAIGQVGYPLFKYFVTYCIVLLTLDSIPKVRGTLAALVLCGVFISLNGLIQYRDGVDLVGQTLNWRGGIQWVGFFDGSNGLALLLVTLFGFSIGFAILKHQGAGWRLFGIVSSGFLLYAILLTGSRGGFLALLAVLFLYLYVKFPMKPRNFILLALCLLVLILILKPTEEGRGMGESTTAERVELFHQGLQMIKAQPLKGIGSGEFEHNNPVHKVAHNIWLQHMAETGVIGGTIYVMMYYLALRGLFNLMRKKNDHEVYNLVVQIFAGAIGFFASAFFLTVTYELPYILLALVSTLPIIQGETLSLRWKDFVFVGITNIALLAAIYIAVQLFFILYR